MLRSSASHVTLVGKAALVWVALLSSLGSGQAVIEKQSARDKDALTTDPYLRRGENGFNNLPIPSSSEASPLPKATVNRRQAQEIDELSSNTTSKCRVPQFVGDWKVGTKYRFPVAEAQGAMIGRTFVIVSGFLRRFKVVTRSTFSLDTTKRFAIWRRRDPHPLRQGVTHAGSAVVGTKFYMCGGYLGGHPGPHTDKCYVLDIAQPRRKQWSSFASLPDGGRSGGGMFYHSAMNALFYAAGAKRIDGHTIDFNNTWMYSLDNTTAGWIPKAPIPFNGNHVSFVTAYDETGKERHYIVGGQGGEDEANDNKAENFEYDADNDVWIQRHSMPTPRGHAASSTRAIGCGYIVAAGTINGGLKESDVSYYDIPTDSWTSIGSLPKAIKTPVCDLSGEVFLCESGFDKRRFSYKRRLVV